MKMKEGIQIHPTAAAFPILPSKETRELKADIEAHGILVPILVNKKRDTILDGRNRYWIAHDLKMTTVPVEEFEGEEKDIPGEIISRNLYRRHLTDNQRVAIVTKLLAPKLQEEAKERIKNKGAFNKDGAKASAKGTVADKIKEVARVSKHKANQAIRAHKAGVIDDVIADRTSLKKGAKKTPVKKRKAAKVLTLEQEVLKKFGKFLQNWTKSQEREVKQILRDHLNGNKNGKK